MCEELQTTELKTTVLHYELQTETFLLGLQTQHIVYTNKVFFEEAPPLNG